MQNNIMKKQGFSITFSFGRYGGFYIHKGYSMRVCLGWMAITLFPEDIDDLIRRISGTPKIHKDFDNL